MYVVTTQQCNSLAVIWPGQDTEFSMWKNLEILYRSLRPRILLSLFDILSIWVLQDRLKSVTKPRSRNSDVSSRILLFKCKSEWIGVFLLVICISLIFFTLNSMRFYWLHAYKLSRSDWNTEWSTGQFIILDVLQSSAYNDTQFPGITTSVKSLMKITKNKGPNKEPRGMPNGIAHHVEFISSMTTLCSLSVK